jgi:selT/selW/selH-like putative selenoprotein
LNANGISAEDIRGTRGQFDVVRDGEVIFSKQESERFPEPGEILAALQQP